MTRPGRPRVPVDVERVLRLRALGWGWKRIAREMGLAPLTVKRAVLGGYLPRSRAAPAAPGGGS